MRSPMEEKEAQEFAHKWLPTWTGNEPEKLAGYYSDDVYYSDPGIPLGVKGKKNLISYFRKLLSQNPDWIWEQVEAIPMEGGFVNKWRAQVPVGEKVLVCLGVCFLQFNDDGEIERNEVYFDRTELVSEIFKLNRKGG